MFCEDKQIEPECNEHAKVYEKASKEQSVENDLQSTVLKEKEERA